MSDVIAGVTRPRVVAVRRVQPRGCSAGDEVLVRMEPGLLRLLERRDAQGRSLGEGLAAEWWLPLGAASTAATRAGGSDSGWTGVTLSVEWTRAARDTETLLARSVVERTLPRRFGRTALVHRYEVASEGTGEVLARGTLVLATAEGEPPASAPAPASFSSSDVAAPAPPARGLKARLRAAAVAWLPPALAAVVRRARRAPDPPAATAEPAALRWTAFPARLELGAEGVFEVQVTRSGALPEALEVVLEPPFGFGLQCAWSGSPRVQLEKGQSVRLRGVVRALRADEVNLGRPWALTCVLKTEGREWARLQGVVAVADPAPARVVYVLTEDCETFDGAESTGRYGALRVMGNANGFMDPEEYRIQMIAKPQALNRIADRYGARWTHFWTTTQLAAARWAGAQSRTGAWARIVSELEDSVRQGSRRHEYAPHIHFDYEPDSALPPQPRLKYDAATDGLLPREYYDAVHNAEHKFHGWDGARKGIAYVREEGDLALPDTKAGSLRTATRLLGRLAPDRGPLLLTRTGACDFGASPDDLGASFRALEANGLLANADAGHYQHVGEHPRGRQIYFCRRSDLETEIDDLREAGPVQLRAPEVQLDGASLDELNAWFQQRLAQAPSAGVGAVVAMTHAMFMKGAPDPFRDTTGGDFEKLDQHLEYVRRQHPEVAFATGSEAVLEFLDYYTPTLRAVAVRPRFRSLDGRTVLFPVRILGRGIPVGPEQPMAVTVTAPAVYDPSELELLRVLENGTPVASIAPEGERLPALEFLARGRDGYELEARMKATAALTWPAADAPPPGSPHVTGEELLDAPEPDVFRLEGPELLRAQRTAEGRITAGDTWEWALSPEPFRLLASPVAGGTEPLGRGVHPYGMYPLGVALHAAREVCPGGRPLQADVRWRRAMTGRHGFRLRSRVERVDASQVVVESQFFEAAAECAHVRITLAVDEGRGAPTPQG